LTLTLGARQHRLFDAAATQAIAEISVSRAGLMQIDLSFERNEVYECGAALVTALANPKDIDGKRSHQIFLSLCGSALWLRHSLNPVDEAPIKVKPQYVFRDHAVIDRDVKYAAKRLGERMVAARMAMPFFKHDEIGHLVSLPSGIPGFPLINWLNMCLRTLGRSTLATSSDGSGLRAARLSILRLRPRTSGSSFATTSIRRRLKAFSSIGG
jgi:hypothetical protein